MSDNPKHLFEAAFDCKTAEAFKAELERAPDVQVNFRDGNGSTVLNWMCFNHGAKQIDQWVKQYKDHAEFGYIFRENARDVLNKQNPESVKKTLAYLASLVV